MNFYIDQLLSDLRAIEESPEITKAQYLTDGSYDELHKLVQNAVDSANDALITNNGQVKFAAIAFMRDHGYNVFAGEKDSFGWLTGCIRTDKGIIVFG